MGNRGRQSEHEEKALTCPRCGAELVPIVYGYPPPVEQARRGECVVGGCLVTDRSPRWACPRFALHALETLLGKAPGTGTAEELLAEWIRRSLLTNCSAGT